MAGLTPIVKLVWDWDGHLQGGTKTPPERATRCGEQKERETNYSRLRKGELIAKRVRYPKVPYYLLMR